MITRKPVHIEATTTKPSKGKSYGRQAMWEAMRKQKVFTLSDVALDSRRDTTSVKAYVKRLLAGGIIKEIGEVQSPKSNNESYKMKQYELVKDMGHAAPRLNPDGTPLIRARDQMWIVMKMLPTFNFLELAMDASTDELTVSPIDARDYLKHLYKAGYLFLVQESGPSKKAVYRLNPKMNTGPHAPMVQRTKVVFDANLMEIMWNEPLEP